MPHVTLGMVKSFFCASERRKIIPQRKARALTAE
jgi:hypothetical protein